MYQKALLISFALLLAGCNTMHGLGEDMQSAGEGLSEGARNIKKKMNGDRSDSGGASHPTSGTYESESSATSSGSSSYRDNPYSSY